MGSGDRVIDEDDDTDDAVEALSRGVRSSLAPPRSRPHLTDGAPGGAIHVGCAAQIKRSKSLDQHAYDVEQIPVPQLSWRRNEHMGKKSQEMSETGGVEKNKNKKKWV